MEEVFNSTWDLKDNLELNLDENVDKNDKIVKSLYEELLELILSDLSDKEQDSSIETVIYNIKEK